MTWKPPKGVYPQQSWGALPQGFATAKPLMASTPLHGSYHRDTIKGGSCESKKALQGRAGWNVGGLVEVDGVEVDGSAVHEVVIGEFLEEGRDIAGGGEVF